MAKRATSQRSRVKRTEGGLSRGAAGEEPSGLPRTRCFVVGVGASAGGLEALGRFFADLPRDCGLAFVVVQHLSPDYKSFMVELLSKRTQLPVLRAEDGQEVAPNHVYLIPPKKHLKIFKGKLLLVEPAPDRGINLPIDVFFRSLAEDLEHRAIGVVLSGTGSDGTMGIRAVKDAGGMVMVQSEATAQFDGMPRSAISTGLADFIAPPEELARLLLQYIQHPFVGRERPVLRDQGSSEMFMNKIFAVLRERAGVDFSFYKPGTIDRRVERRMSINQIHTLAEYYRYLEGSPREATALFNELLICVTRFFRDREAFEFLEQSVLPGLLARTPSHEPLRVWVPGCSTGEEAYSLAIQLTEAAEKADLRRDVKVFATDISKEALDAASLGLYTESMVADVPLERLNQHFVKRPDGYQVANHIRKMVVFARQDLLRDPPFTRLDLVSCRNLLIYFQPVLQSKALAAFHFALRPGGILFLGSSETVGELMDRFQVLSARHKVYQQRPASRPLPLGTFTGLAARSPLHLTAITPLPGRPGRPGDGRAAFENICREIIGECTPACLVVDERHEIVQLFGRAGDYLRHPEGAPTNHVLKLTAHGLASALAPALHKAARDQGSFTCENVAYRDGDKVRQVRLRVKTMHQPPQGELLYLIFIEDKPSTPDQPPPLETLQVDPTAAERIRDLEQELTYTKESLQATVEELETSNEELQASNEELLAANEELQSTNEELQSVNEELHTVNSENQNRIEELVELTNDINNLMLSTQVATLLVDQQLRIRRVSSAACALTRLTPQDVGAPLEVLARVLETQEVMVLAGEILQRQQPAEREATLRDGRCLLLRGAPYRTETNTGSGLVLTLIDITARKQSEERVHRSEGLTRDVLNALPAHIAVVEPDGCISQVNEAWLRFARTNSAPRNGPVGVGANYFTVCEAALGADGPLARTALTGLRSVLDGRMPVFELEYPCHSPHEQRWFLLHATRLQPPTGGLVVSHIDITELRRHRDAAAGAGQPTGNRQPPTA